MGYSSRKPYYALGKSQIEFFGGSSRFLKESLDKESQFEKPYLDGEYQQMHLNLPKPSWPSLKPGGPIGVFGEIRRILTMLYTFPPPGCGFVSASGLRGGSTFNGNIGFGGTIGYGFGLDCGDVSVLTFRANSFFTEQWSWTFSLSSGDLNIGDISRSIAGDSISIWTDVQGTKGTVRVCGAGTAGKIPLLWSIRYKEGAQRPELFRDGLSIVWNELATQEGKVHCCEEVLFNCSKGCTCADSSIGYTTQQMAVNEVQTLTVVDPVAGCTYAWAIDSGGGSLSAATATSVDYTASGSNADCANNPTISLSVEGNVCDTLQIAVNAVAGLDIAYHYQCIPDPGYTSYCCVKRFHCDGTDHADQCECIRCACMPYGQPICCLSYTCAKLGGTGILDKRSAALKRAGCCPAALL